MIFDFISCVLSLAFGVAKVVHNTYITDLLAPQTHFICSCTLITEGQFVLELWISPATTFKSVNKFIHSYKCIYLSYLS